MGAKSVSVSLPEALVWKLDQLEQRYGIPRSALILKGVLLLIAETQVIPFEFGQLGADVSQGDVEKEFASAMKGKG